MTRSSTRGIIVGLLLAGTVAHAAAPTQQAQLASVEQDILAVHRAMTAAGEAGDADALFSHILDSQRGSIAQDGVLMASREEALARVRPNMRNAPGVRYQWDHTYVSVLSADAAVQKLDQLTLEVLLGVR